VVRLACVVEYDGGGFLGWQHQRRGRTVQAALERALSAVADHPVQTVCAGRTDAGVHATGQVVHFDSDAPRPDHAWMLGANTHLPRDVALRWVGRVRDDFHARASAERRDYRYLLVEGGDRPALWRDRVGWTPHRLDEAAMRAGAAHLIGEHDFNAFRAAECQAHSPMRCVDRIAIERQGRLLVLTIRGNAFLHNMVRIIVGTLVAVGRGHHDPGWVATVLAGRDRRAAGATAAAQGLYFLGPVYPAGDGVPVPASGDLATPGG